MTDRTLDRRTLLRSAGAGLAPLAAGRSGADPVGDVVNDAVRTTPSLFGEVGRRINQVRYPLTGVPAVREPGEILRVELDFPTELESVEIGPEDLTATLTPSFGAASTVTELPLETYDPGESVLWGDREFHVARFEVPRLDRAFTEGLYDLTVDFGQGVDGQPRAVSVHRSFPDDPDVVIMGDPHVGDPRPAQDGFEQSVEEGDPDPFLYRFGETFGAGDPEEEWWGPFRRANAEVNASDPDLVLVIGDLAFGSTFYYQEYEDAYRLLNGIDAPTFVTVGNHDGYVTPGAGIDGKELWRRYFAPWRYSVDVRPDLHFVSFDSYDWPPIDRIAPSAVPSTWGGQVRDEQLDWLEADLRSWRAHNDGTILTMCHHNPSWRQTEGGQLSETAGGTSGAEQVARGAEQSGGGWVGANRLAVRDLLAEVGVSLHVSGHAHRDRVARYHGDSTVVETTGRGLEHVGPEGEVLDTSAERKRDVLATGEGPLFLEATTAASGTSLYWGWRRLDLPLDGSPVDPRTFGYPASDEFLEAHALRPGQWSAENADLGLYSTPSYRFDAETVEATEERTTVRLYNDLARSFGGAVTLPLTSCRGVRVTNGHLHWRRDDGEWQDVRVGFTVPAGETLEVTVECRSNEPR